MPKTGHDGFGLGIAFQILEFLLFEVVNFKGLLLGDGLLDVANEESHIFYLLDYAIEGFFFLFIRLLHTSLVFGAFKHVLALLGRAGIVGVEVHLSEGAIVHLHFYSSNIIMLFDNKIDPFFRTTETTIVVI